MKFSNSDHSPRHSTLLLFCFGLSLGYCRGLSGGSDSRESSCNTGDWVQSLGQKDPLEKGMANHSRILVWKIPWTEDPGRLQSMELQRVRHNWATNTFTLWHIILLGKHNLKKSLADGLCSRLQRFSRETEDIGWSYKSCIFPSTPTLTFGEYTYLEFNRCSYETMLKSKRKCRPFSSRSHEPRNTWSYSGHTSNT